MNDLEQVEINITEAKEKIAIRDSLEQLTRNKHWKKVIDTGYLEQEAVRLVHLKADLNMKDEASQADIIRGIDSIGNLRAYFSKIYQTGQAAQSALASHEQTKEEILAEDLTGDTL